MNAFKKELVEKISNDIKKTKKQVGLLEKSLIAREKQIVEMLEEEHQPRLDKATEKCNKKIQAIKDKIDKLVSEQECIKEEHKKIEKQIYDEVQNIKEVKRYNKDMKTHKRLTELIVDMQSALDTLDGNTN